MKYTYEEECDLARVATYHDDLSDEVQREFGDNPETQNEKVAPIFACPTCGTRDMDSLVWIDDEFTSFDIVECGACGTLYNPNKED